jgi:thiol-disulfide isomerase/thioredoxin
MPSLGAATGWLNSEPLGPAQLRGRVVVVNFWTLTCINWLRQEPYVRAWSQAYDDDGLVVIGVHTPEFAFEREINGVRKATEERAIEYPVAADDDYGIWNAFANHYWPALYFVDADGLIRDHHFGEGRYDESERGHPAPARRRPGTPVRRNARRGGSGRLGPPVYARDLPRIRAKGALRVT